MVSTSSGPSSNAYTSRATPDAASKSQRTNRNARSHRDRMSTQTSSSFMHRPRQQLSAAVAGGCSGWPSPCHMRRRRRPGSRRLPRSRRQFPAAAPARRCSRRSGRRRRTAGVSRGVDARQVVDPVECAVQRRPHQRVHAAIQADAADAVLVDDLRHVQQQHARSGDEVAARLDRQLQARDTPP